MMVHCLVYLVQSVQSLFDYLLHSEMESGSKVGEGGDFN